MSINESDITIIGYFRIKELKKNTLEDCTIFKHKILTSYSNNY